MFNKRAGLKALTILFSVVVTMTAGCTSSTKPHSSVIKGQVELVNDSGDPVLDPVDYSGVLVTIYEQAKLDTLITNVNNQYPGLGVLVNQDSEFDHRNGKMIASSSTLADGSFEISSVRYGRYNLVIQKAGWGYRYMYDVIVDQSVELLAAPSLKLYPEKHLSGFVDYEVSLPRWHHLVVIGNLVFSPESKLSMGPNSVLRIASACKIDIMGQFETTAIGGEMFRVTSDDLTYSRHSISYSDIAPYHSFNLLPTSTVTGGEIAWGIFSSGSVCLSSQIEQSTTIRSCIFRSVDRGLWVINTPDVIVQRSVFRSIGSTNVPVLFYGVSNGQISGNIISEGETGIRCDALSHPLVTNNVIIDNTNGIQVFDGNPNIRNNFIRASEIGIRLAGGYAPITTYNQITAARTIVIGYNGYYTNSRAVINYNNLKASQYCYYMIAFNPSDIDARYNYHYTSSLSEIESKTFHKADYPEAQQYQVGNVIFKPISISAINNAGVTP